MFFPACFISVVVIFPTSIFLFSPICGVWMFTFVVKKNRNSLRSLLSAEEGESVYFCVELATRAYEACMYWVLDFVWWTLFNGISHNTHL